MCCYFLTSANVNHPKHADISNIFLLATEQLEPSDNEQNGDNEIDSGGGGGNSTSNLSNKITTNGATDEELTPLHWLNDKNLLKGLYFVFVVSFLLLVSDIFYFIRSVVMATKYIFQIFFTKIGFLEHRKKGIINVSKPTEKIESKDLNLPFGNSNKLGFCFKLFFKWGNV